MTFECPTCGDEFDTEQGRNSHHSLVHGESLVGASINSSAKPWHDLERLRELYQSGLNTEEISDKFGCQRNTIMRWLKKALSGTDLGYDCPTCGEKFASRKGASIHHKDKHDESIAGFELTCQVCGDIFYYKGRDQKYCSRDCFADAHSDDMARDNHPLWEPRVARECEYCGEIERVPPSIANRPYCSAECAGKDRMSEPSENPFYEGGKKIEKNCEHCGDLFESWECQERKFCSQECYGEHFTGENHPHWTGGPFPYGPGFNEAKKEAVRERDGRECQECGRTEEEHIEKYGTKQPVHHIQKARTFDDPEKRNAMDNLVTLCKGECHKKWERMAPLRPDSS